MKSNYQILIVGGGTAGIMVASQLKNQNPKLDTADQLCVSLETAHPAKFPEQIRKILDLDPELPASLEGIEEKDEQYDRLDNNYIAFKNFLKENY